jgi:uncharacterized protein
MEGKMRSKEEKMRSEDLAALLIAGLFVAGLAPAPHAWAQPLARAKVAHVSGDYVKVAALPVFVRGASAQTRLCFRYQTGRGVPQSFPLAAAYCYAAAEHGDPNAQYLLGLMYDKGQGVEHDVVLAYMWLNLAAAHAPHRLHDPYARLRDAVASKMTAAQIADGQALAVAWAARRR